MSRIFPFGSRRRSRLRSEKLGFLRSPLVSASFRRWFIPCCVKLSTISIMVFSHSLSAAVCDVSRTRPRKGARLGAGIYHGLKKILYFSGAASQMMGWWLWQSFFGKGENLGATGKRYQRSPIRAGGGGAVNFFSGVALCPPLFGRLGHNRAEAPKSAI